MIREYLDRAGAQVLARAIKDGKYEKTTYANLVSLRNNNALTPGKLYRITDYTTTTSLTGTAAAGHVFDLIVMALDKNALSEEACAVTHAGDASYWENSNLSAWRIWYCLDNDKSRFAWADDRTYVTIHSDNEDYAWANGIKMMRNEDGDVDWKGTGSAYAWIEPDELGAYFTNNETPQHGDILYYEDGTETGYIVDKLGINGTGVIYRLIDEWGNDVPYDFKNILYTDINTAGGDCYTFSLKYDKTFTWENVSISDASILGNTIPYSPDSPAGNMTSNGVITWSPSAHPNILGCRDNKIEPCIFTTTTGANTTQSKQTLNKIVLFACAYPAVAFDGNNGAGFAGIYGNTFGANCQDILLGLGDNFGPAMGFDTETFHSNVFGPDCFGFRVNANLCDNQFGAGVNNIIGDNTPSPGQYISNTIFEPGANYINCGSIFTMKYSKFGAGCSYITTNQISTMLNTEVDSSVVGTSDLWKQIPRSHPTDNTYKITYTTMGAQTIVI